MRKHYHYYQNERQTWGYVLTVLALLILFAKAWIFPLLIFFGIWWFVGRGMCRTHGHLDRFDMEKRKHKNDDEDADYVIV